MLDTVIIKSKRDIIIDRILYCLAAIFMPNIFLFDLYNRNRIQNHLPFGATIILAVIFAAVSIALFFLLRLLAKSLEGALIAASAWWVMFWLFEATYSVLLRFSASLSRLMWLAFIVAGIAAIAICFRHYRPPFSKIGPVFRILAATGCGLFVFNFMPAIQHQLAFQRGVDERYEVFLRGDKLFYIKRNFNVDPTIPNPNIYWFHMDGMMSLSTVERFFGESRDDLRTELAMRGFVIYEDAIVYGGETQYALPILLSPAFYDSYFGERISEVDGLSPITRTRTLIGRLSQDGISLANDVAPYYEIFHAFRAADYNIVIICSYPHIMSSVPFDRLYRTINMTTTMTDTKYILLDSEFLGMPTNNFSSEAGDLFRLLSSASPLSLISERISFSEKISWLPVIGHEDMIEQLTSETRNTAHERQLYRAFLDHFSTTSPRLVYIMIYFTHSSTIRHGNPIGMARGEGIPTDVYPVYMAHYNYAAMIMFNKIDIILEQDPNAVIVLQADHGIHDHNELESLLNRGYTEEEVLDFLFSVFSAVRIPEAYGGLDAPLGPRNIARELVNRFVGQNYELLPDRYRD